MSKDNITYPSLITDSLTGDSLITTELVESSPIGVEDEVVPIPPVLEDGNTVGWYDYLENVTKDGSDFVSVHGDKSVEGNDLLQAVGSNQPLWTPDGILYDGIDNFMKAVFTFIQPEMIYIVFKQLVWFSGNIIFDGSAFFNGALQNRPPSPGMVVRAGIESSVNGNLPLNTFGIVRVLFNGANSSFQINETAPIVGNFGSTAMNAFTLASRGAPSQFTNIQVKEVLLRKIADSAQDQQDIYNYLVTKL